MKKLIAILLTAAVLFILPGCDKNESGEDKSTDSSVGGMLLEEDIFDQ